MCLGEMLFGGWQVTQQSWHRATAALWDVLSQGVRRIPQVHYNARESIPIGHWDGHPLMVHGIISVKLDHIYVIDEGLCV